MTTAQKNTAAATLAGKRWDGLSPQQRKNAMKAAQDARWKGKTKADRKKQGKILKKGRKMALKRGSKVIPK